MRHEVLKQNTLVQVIDLPQNIDDRGILYEVARTDADWKPTLNQVYVVKDRTAGIIRAFHKHHQLWDYFHILSGSATFMFWKDATEEGLAPTPQKVVLDSRKPQLIIVPPEVWHGWMSLEPNTILLSCASHTYNKQQPDEVRCSPNVLGNIWQVEAK